uniref:C-type lectin domain-containing protein n=1 Tax=Oryzias latipes TaxID=8090 RepID=A0A3P9HI97_ORYLA
MHIITTRGRLTTVKQTLSSRQVSRAPLWRYLHPSGSQPSAFKLRPSVTGSCQFGSRQTVLPGALKTWEESQQACRQLYSDLATVVSPAESTRLLGAVQEPGELAWIGLYDNMAKWKWTMGHPDFDSNIDYHNWQFDNPKFKGTKDTCGTIRYNGLWRDEICDTERPFKFKHKLLFF